MKRFFKYVAVIVCVLLAIPMLGLLCAYGAYHNVVRATPGSLSVGVSPGSLGAMVNPFVGTGGFPWMCAYDTPAATVPFGMVRLGPDTASLFIKERAVNAAGYYYGDNKIIGFSHTRLVGADAEEGGHFRIFPTVAARIEKMRGTDRFARFSHREETAFPGYYAVKLPKDDILAEMTASTRVGVHRYTFQKDDVPHLLLDVSSALGQRKTVGGAVKILPAAQEAEGTIRSYGAFSGRYDGLEVFFVARFSQPFTGFSVWKDGEFTPDSTETSGDNIGVDLSFARQPGAVVEVRLALSYVSVENARKNLESEAAGKSFDELFTLARDAWEKRLARIRVEGGDDRQQRIFYTSLYHAFLMPTTFNDVNNEYRGFDRLVHKAEGFTYYTDFSIWDTARTVHPLYNLIAREDVPAMMTSLVEMAKAGGCLPRWPSGCGYTNCMFGTPADMVVSEAYLKGIRGFDIEAAYNAMRQTALVGVPAGSKFGGRNGLDAYLQYGYCPSDKMNKAVSATLEYGWADYALSLLAKELGREEDAALLAKHAQHYRNTWNPDTQYFQPRNSDGSFVTPFDPFKSSYIGGEETKDVVEGSALQWRWSVPYDPEGLISLFSSRDFFVSELETFFTKTNKRLGWWFPGSYYWHGNEPDINAVYLFNSAGRPDLTQKWVRYILEHKYADDFVGLDGNDDGGTLSAWYVFSALGLYPIAGTTRYELGAPLFDAATVNMGGTQLKITADNNTPENGYVQRVTLNGKPVARTWLTHDEIAQGGTLHFEMGASPVTP